MARAKKKATGQTNKDAIPQTRPEGRPASVQPAPTFHFLGFNVLGLLFQQLAKAPLAEGPPQAAPQRVPTQISVTANLGVSTENVGQLRLVVTVVPDPRVQPYNIVVDVVGMFSTVDGTTEQLAHFCRLAAPGILFPYVREIVDRTTTYGPYGPVRLDPMNINQFLNQTPWADTPTSPAISTASSTAPEQP